MMSTSVDERHQERIDVLPAGAEAEPTYYDGMRKIFRVEVDLFWLERLIREQVYDCLERAR